MLVRGEFFSTVNPNSGQSDQILYWLTPASRLILQDIDSDLNYAPMVLMHHHPKLLAPWQYLSPVIKEGGVAFEKAHGRSIWGLLSDDPDFNKVFHAGLACTAKIGFRMIATEYEHVFADVRSVVDVGGGTGTAVTEIVKAFPHIKAINFDVPHVISIAPQCPGVTHVEGDMFKAIPNADVAILKSILHDWSDEDCVKILVNCRKAIPEKTGKIILFEQLAEQEAEKAMDDTVSASNLLMKVHTGAGKERTELQCKILLEKAGFPRSRLISSPGLPSIIQGYLE